jgi:hypothetical protein
MEQDWKRQLRREASAHGMCRENRDALDRIEDKGSAISLYKKTIDWALEEGYPNFGTIQRDFADCEQYGVFVNRDFHGELLNEQRVYVFHHCTGTVRVGLNADKRIIPMLYFANNCDMTLKSGGASIADVRVPLYIFGNNLIKHDGNGNVVFHEYKFETK